MVGASRDPKKFGSMAMKELKQRGYQVFPVNPAAQMIEGEVCYPSLGALSGRVEGVVVAVPPQQAVQVLREAAGAGIRNVWLQQQTESPEALELAQRLGLNVVSKKCILMYAPPVRSFHGVHRFFARITGQL
jgi:predicted CoA-binding protein